MAEPNEQPNEPSSPGSARLNASDSTTGFAAPMKSGDGLAVASLVLGILACITFWIFPVCAVFAAVSLFLGRQAQKRLRNNKNARPGAKGWANAGIVLSMAGCLVSVVLYVSCYFTVQKLASDGQKEYGKAIQELENDPEFKKRLEELRDDIKQLDEHKDGGSNDDAAEQTPQ